MSVDTNVDVVETDPRAFIKNLFKHTPYHKLLGFELVDVTADRLKVVVRHKPDLVSGRGTLHGGVVASIVDAAGAFHAGVVARRRDDANPDAAKQNRVIATIDLHVDYLRPLKGESFVATTSLVYAGSAIARLRCEIFDEQEVLVATAGMNYSY